MRAQASSLFASVMMVLAVVCPCAGGQNLFRTGSRNHLKKTLIPQSDSKPGVDQSNVAAQVEQALHLRQNLKVQDLNSAIRVFKKSASQYRRSGAVLKAAGAEREAGDTYFMMGRYRPALDEYRLALTFAAREPEARCTILAHMARAFANMGDIPHAQQDVRRALACYKDGLNPRVKADILEAQGETYFWKTQWEAAIEPLSRARDLFSLAGDHEGEALSLLMLANAKVGIKHDSYRAEAPQHARDALRLWSAAENRYGIARAHAVLAFMAGTSGNFELAQCHCDQALPVFQRMGDKEDEAILLITQGSLAKQTGDVQMSLAYYRKARQTFAGINDREGEIKAITGIGAALTALGQYQRLPPLYSQKLRLAQQTGSQVLVASALMNLAGIHQRNREYDKAGELYRQALEKYSSAGQAYAEGDALIRLAYLSIEQGKDDQAI